MAIASPKVECGRINHCSCRLQVPVAPEPYRRGKIRRRRHIRPGRLRETADELHSRIPRRHIAAIQQDVAALGQRLPNGVQLTGMRGQRGAIDDAAAQRHATGTAMRDDVDGIDARAPLQVPGNLV